MYLPGTKRIGTYGLRHARLPRSFLTKEEYPLYPFALALHPKHVSPRQHSQTGKQPGNNKTTKFSNDGRSGEGEKRRRKEKKRKTSKTLFPLSPPPTTTCLRLVSCTWSPQAWAWGNGRLVAKTQTYVTHVR